MATQDVWHRYYSEALRTAVKEKKEIDWTCTDCSTIQPPLHQSPAHSPDSAIATPDFAPLITPPPGFGTLITPPPCFASPASLRQFLLLYQYLRTLPRQYFNLLHLTIHLHCFPSHLTLMNFQTDSRNSFQEPTVLEEFNLEQTLPTSATEDTIKDPSEPEPDLTIVWRIFKRC